MGAINYKVETFEMTKVIVVFKSDVEMFEIMKYLFIAVKYKVETSEIIKLLFTAVQYKVEMS